MTDQNIEKVSQALADFDRVSAGIAALRETYAGVLYDCTTTDGLDAAKKARLAIREPRYEVERVRKDAKAPILAIGKKIDDEAKRITAELLKIEEPIDAQIKAIEERREAERQARIAAEAARVSEIRGRIATIAGWPAQYATAPASLLAQQVRVAEDYTIDETFAEFREEACRALAASLDSLRTLHAGAVAREEEKARVEAERAELERLRREDAERKAAEEREAAARRQAEEAELDSRRKAVEAAEAKIAAEKAASAPAPTPEPPPSAPAASGPRPCPPAKEIIDVLADHYRASRSEVIGWLRLIVAAKAA